MITDPISNMLTSIRNALAAQHEHVLVPYSKTKHAIADILVAEKYVGQCEAITQKHKMLKITLQYDREKKPVIRTLNRISRPGSRIYRKYSHLPIVLNNLGIAIVSTSQGLMTNKDARKKKLGGEVICEVY